MEWIYYPFIIWLFGTLYQTVELFWRRRTHVSMFWAGGLCGLLLETVCNGIFYSTPLFFRCLLGALVITGVEFCFGCLVNLKLGLNVWDYSEQKGHILGQICPVYSALWVVISLPALLLLEGLNTVILTP